MTKIVIPAGPKEEGWNREIELDLVDNIPAIRLVQTRHLEGRHPDPRLAFEINSCQDCAEISKRAYRITHPQVNE